MLYVTIYGSYIDLSIAAYHLGSFDTGHTWRRPWVASWHAAYYALCGIQERHASFVSYIECNPSCSDHACWKHNILMLFHMVCFQVSKCLCEYGMDNEPNLMAICRIWLLIHTIYLPVDVSYQLHGRYKQLHTAWMINHISFLSMKNDHFKLWCRCRYFYDRVIKGNIYNKHMVGHGEIYIQTNISSLSLTDGCVCIRGDYGDGERWVE